MQIEQHFEQYIERGYFVADDMIDPEMLDALEAAMRRVREKIRSGAVDIKTAFADNREPIVMWGLIAPEFDEPIFAEYLLSAKTEAYAHAFLGKELRLGTVACFATDNETPYDTGWHRDLGGQDKGASEAEELALLNAPKNELKWHLALVDDPCLWIVPGSQRRYRTQEERVALTQDRHAPLANAQAIKIKRGQTLFWDGCTIHRGWTPEALKERLSLVGQLCKSWPDEPADEKVDERYQWRLADNIRAHLPAKMQLYYDRWRALQPV